MEKAIEVLKNGGIVIFPTDTAYGIGCRVDEEESVKKLFTLRRRPSEKAVSILVDSIEMAKQYTVGIDEKVVELMKKYWPGGLTIVLKARVNMVSKQVRGGGETVGVRMPNHQVTLELIKGLGHPILGPSANFAGGKTPYQKEDLDSDLISLVDYLVPGENGGKLASTVVDCTQNPWKILREGSVQI